MIIDCISDMHGEFPSLEGGDLLIVAGDLTGSDKPEQYNDFCTWLMNQNYKKKIFIGGNHDNLLKDSVPKIARCPVRKDFQTGEYLELFEYLCDSGTEFDGLTIWGSPWTRRFDGMNPRCMAFTVETDEELAEKWWLIPDDTDILVTHCPPWGILDKTRRGEHVGSKSLALKIGTMETPPKLWVWGHIHEGYGIDKPIRGKPCIMVNSSIMNEHYEPVNKPVRIEI